MKEVTTFLACQCWPKIKQSLDRLDERAITLLKNFQRVLVWLKTLDRKVERLDPIVLAGASKGLVKKRTGNRFLDWLNSIWYDCCRWLDKLDSKAFFRGRIYQAKDCRVRSKQEKEIANFLTAHGIRFQYERSLIFHQEKPMTFFGEARVILVAMTVKLLAVTNLYQIKNPSVRRFGIIVVRPDFYLKDYGVYLEYWGLIDQDPKYKSLQQFKLDFYRRHNISVISLYPSQLGKLDQVFPKLFEERTGKSLLT